jgi:hypothetical protein
MPDAQFCYSPLGQFEGDTDRYIPSVLFGCVPVMLLSTNYGSGRVPMALPLQEHPELRWEDFAVGVHLNEVAALASDVAARGFEALDNGDKEQEAEIDHRLKWLGLFHKRKHHYGRFMMRLKLPGGFVTAPQLRVLADAIANYGDDITVLLLG